MSLPTPCLDAPRSFDRWFPLASRVLRSRWGIVAVAILDNRTGDLWHHALARAPFRAGTVIGQTLCLAFPALDGAGRETNQ